MKTTVWKQIMAVVFLISTALSCSLIPNKQPQSNAPQVDVYANTKGEAHVFLGANTPLGCIQIGPQTRGASTAPGYNYNDSIITGFILSYSDEHEDTIAMLCEGIRFFPSTKHEHEAKFYHKFEVAKLGYYSIFMHETDIAVELTATKNTVFQRYFFPQMDSVQVVVDQRLTSINDSTVTGKTENLYFIIEISRPFIDVVSENGKDTKLFFDATEEEMLYIKVGVSKNSQEEANTHIENELSDWDYEQATARAIKTWNEYLKK